MNFKHIIFCHFNKAAWWSFIKLMLDQLSLKKQKKKQGLQAKNDLQIRFSVRANRR